MALATLTPQEEERLARERQRNLQRARREKARQQTKREREAARQLKAFRDWNDREGVLYRRMDTHSSNDSRAREAWLDHWKARPLHPAEVKR